MKNIFTSLLITIIIAAIFSLLYFLFLKNLSDSFLNKLITVLITAFFGGMLKESFKELKKDFAERKKDSSNK
jgi:hypothetical protein